MLSLWLSLSADLQSNSSCCVHDLERMIYPQTPVKGSECYCDSCAVYQEAVACMEVEVEPDHEKRNYHQFYVWNCMHKIRKDETKTCIDENQDPLSTPVKSSTHSRFVIDLNSWGIQPLNWLFAIFLTKTKWVRLIIHRKWSVRLCTG